MDVVARAAVGISAGGVEPRAEVVELGVWVRQQVPGDDQDGAAGGDDGALGPRRRAMRRCRSPGKVLVLAAPAAALPKMAAR